MNIYVGNLHFDLSEDELKKAFEEYGEVTAVKIIADKATGRSRGFGFVEMANDNEAREAINNLNGADIKGRKVNVNQAREKERNNSGDRKYRS
jgi:RNA recognition motif-containing protein